MVLPHLCRFQDDDVTVSGRRYQIIVQGYQKYLTKWYREICPTRPELIQLSEAYPSLDTRLAHVSLTQHTGPHKPFDLYHKITV